MEEVMAKGVAHVQQAVTCDQAGQHSEALRLYELALQSFVLCLKYERNDRVRNTLDQKIKEYLSRAEAIKGMLSGKSPGQVGCSYDSLFGRYLSGASVISVEDPYIRADHQIHNFVRFCELVMKRAGNECLIHLMTTAESPTQKSQIESSFSLLKSSLSSFSSSSDPVSASSFKSLQLVLTFSDTMHDRAIRLNNGWVIKIGRGLDIYAKSQSKFSVGNFDMDLRPCLETTVDIFKESN